MYFEVFHKGNLIKRGNDILETLEWENELMTVPSLNLLLPITYYEYISGHDEIKVYVNGKVFWGIVERIDDNKEEETMTVYLEHVVNEWTYRQISINNAIKDKKVNIIYKGAETATSGNVTITASPFDMALEEYGTLSAAHYIKRAGATAWTKDGNPVTGITVDSSAIKEKEGSYDVKFTAKGATVTVKATVKATTHKKENANTTVEASDFLMLSSEVPMTDAQYRDRANAKATQNGSSVTPSVDASAVSSTPGTYTVYFSVGDVKVNATATVRASYDAETGDATVADNLSDIYADKNFAYPGWVLSMSSKAGNTTIDYVYSRQNKLEALNKTMELTPDLFWRVRFVDEKVIDISTFGKKKQWILSTKPSGPNNISVVADPTITHDFENVINIATVYSEKSDSGMSSMTLREVYEDPSLQEEGFPVVILRTNVNNERDYTKYITQYPKLAPNNELEYAVIDEESVALESGTLIEGTYAFNDLQPFEIESSGGKTKEVTDKDRIKAAKTAYSSAIRKLKEARRTYSIEVETEELPADLAPGDMVRFIYDNDLLLREPCSAYMKKILSYDDWYYITKIGYNIEVGGVEHNTVTLEKFLRTERDTVNQ